MSYSYWLDRSQGKNKIYDATIIGGGIAGLSAAYWLLQEDPGLKIAIVEKYELGSGATGRNAGFITCGSVEHFNRLVEKNGQEDAYKIWRFSEENLNLLKKHIIKDEHSNLEFESKGSFSLASSLSEFAELKKSADLMSRLKINVETLEQDEIKKRLGAKNFVGGIKYSDDASIHPLKLLGRMRRRLVEVSENVDFFENHEVSTIEKQGDNVLVKTQKTNFESSFVIMATNAYSKLLHSYFEDKVFPTRGQILATAPVERFMEGPCYANFVLDYFRQLPSGELIIGGFRQLQKDAEVGYSDETTSIIQKALENFIQQHLPKLKGVPITHRWSGVMGFSADGNPLIGALPDNPQVYFLVGFTAHGLGLAFHCAKSLVDLIYGREIPSFLNARRF